MEWVTREHPKTDRIACPWLIRRFIDPDAKIVYLPAGEVLAYAERLVEEGKAPSVSAVFNDALAERARRDRRALDRLREIATRADAAKVSRMIAHIDAQAAAIPKK